MSDAITDCDRESDRFEMAKAFAKRRELREEQDAKTAPKNNIQEGKLRMHLLPLDLLSEILCPAYEEGVWKYREESWREGFKMSVMADAALRHISAFVNKGEDYDVEAMEKFGIKKTHIGGAIFSLICMYQTMMDYPQLDDRPTKLKHKGEENASNNEL